ncbi:hypothetical protein KKH26_00255, partial [Patescibacteria group bacterium]|nr:hypothetical protein [Patescibacteria group bacterium]
MKTLVILHGWQSSKEKWQKIRDFFLVAFSHILKNCSIWLQGSTKPTRDLKKKPVKPYDALRKHLKKMQRGNDAFYKVITEKVKGNSVSVLLTDEDTYQVRYWAVDNVDREGIKNITEVIIIDKV